MRFIGNHPIPEHVNPPEDVSGAKDNAVEDRGSQATASAADPEAAQRRKRGRPRLQKNPEGKAA
jgi:hypothetical protein